MILKLDQSIWIKYYDGRPYSGVVKNIESTKEGTLITVLTEERGYRTVSLGMCSLLKPTKKDLARLKND